MSDVETLEDLKKWEWNDPTDPVRFVNMRSDAYRIVFQEETPYLLGRHFAGIFETSLWLRGIENFLCDLHANPGFAESLLDIITEMKIQYWEKALEAVGDNVMIVTEADDLGTQESLMLSPEMYRRFLKPRHTKIHALIKKKAKKQVKIFFHSCGAIYDIVPDLIESHIDILNPWQVSAHGMVDTKKFKQEFGKDITIWGGGCDSQRVLNLGTPQEVRDETKRRIDDLAPGGGFVFTPVHNIQGEVPPENIMAMWETWDEYGRC
jgi:uroporphyrinogen decarboxylase